MWPPRRPARGSGASPRKRLAARASTICSRLLSISAFTSSTERTSVLSSRAVKWRSRGGVGSSVTGPALGHPFRQAAVEHRHVLVAHGAEHPPHAAGAGHRRGVVDHDLVAVAQPELAHARGELLRRGQHVRQRARGVGDLVDVEEHRAGNVLVGELRLGIALLRRQVERAVDEADVRRVEVGRQPVGADQGVGSGVVSSGRFLLTAAR